MERSGRTNAWESPPSSPAPSRERWGRLWGLRRQRRPAGAWAPALYLPAPHPSPPPEFGLAPWRVSARCRGAGVGGANPAGCGEEAEGGFAAPASPRGWHRPHAPSVRSPQEHVRGQGAERSPGEENRGRVCAAAAAAAAEPLVPSLAGQQLPPPPPSARGPRPERARRAARAGEGGGGGGEGGGRRGREGVGGGSRSP